MISILENEEGTTRPSGVSPERTILGYPYHAALETHQKRSYKNKISDPENLELDPIFEQK